MGKGFPVMELFKIDFNTKNVKLNNNENIRYYNRPSGK